MRMKQRRLVSYTISFPFLLRMPMATAEVTVVAEAMAAETEGVVATAEATVAEAAMEVVMEPVMVAVVQVWVATAATVPRVALVMILQEIPLRVMCQVTQFQTQNLNLIQLLIQNQNQSLTQYRIQLPIQLLSQLRIQLRHPEMVLVMVVASYLLVVG